MNTLTNERLKELSTMRGADSGVLEEAIKETAEMAREILSLRAQLATSIKRESAARKGFDEQLERANAAEAQLADLMKQPPFMYGIADPDGKAYFDEFCVSADRGLVEDAVNSLNHDREDGDELSFTMVQLYLRPAPQATSQKITVTDDMAMAFHRATTDGDVGSDDVSDIKIGLNAALCNISVQPYTVPDERAAYETFIAKRLGDSIDTQRARNGDPEKPDYMAWDMTVGWIAWQGRAGMLQHHSGDAADKVNSPELPDGWALVPIEPTIDMCGAGAVVPQHKGE